LNQLNSTHQELKLDIKRVKNRNIEQHVHLLFSCNKLHYLFALFIVLYIIFKLFITIVVTLQIQIILQYDRIFSSLTTFNLFNQRFMKLSHYFKKKKIRQEAMNKIHQNFSQLKIKENSEYV